MVFAGSMVPEEASGTSTGENLTLMTSFKDLLNDCVIISRRSLVNERAGDFDKLKDTLSAPAPVVLFVLTTSVVSEAAFACKDGHRDKIKSANIECMFRMNHLQY